MKEQEFISAIKSVIGDRYIGDDCAYLKESGLVVSQDNLVEDVHFSMKYTTPYKLGYKSAMVNISDIAAAGGKPEYMTVGLSLPEDTTAGFIKDFYHGLKDAGKNIEIVGGDLTGADKIMISVSILGSDKNRKISSRSRAKSGYVIITSGVHGSSAGGLRLLFEGKTEPRKLITAHLMPEAQTDFASKISENINEEYAMMDTSDGLADALFKIAQASGKTILLDFDKVLYDKELQNTFPQDYKEMILYGGEDYQIVAAVPEKFLNKLDNVQVIGYVKDRVENTPLQISDSNHIEQIHNLDKCFNHFK